MSKFNKKEKPEVQSNYMGEKAIKEGDKFDLVNILLTSFVENQYYESATDITKRLLDYVSKMPKFSAKASIFARNEFGMRSITNIVGAEIPFIVKKERWVKDFIERVVFRADDMTEILSLYLAKHGKPIPNSLKKGLASAFEKFDKYQIAKYKGEGKKVNMVDLVRLVHPKDSEIKDLLIRGELKSVDTWEAKLSEAGKTQNVASAKKQAWDDLVKNKKLGYFATLRNLRNIMEQAPHLLPDVAKFLSNPTAIKNSKVFPFRFISAMDSIEGSTAKAKIKFEKSNDVDLVKILNDAVTISCQNLPEFSGKTVILVDNSGSMRGDSGGNSLLSIASKTKTSDIANLFGAMYWMRADNTYVGVFGDTLKHVKMDRNKTLLENYKIIDNAGRNVGASTEQGVFEFFIEAIDDKITDIARIFIFSDMQIGSGCSFYTTSSFKHGYKHGAGFMKIFREFQRMSPETKVYTINLKSYSTTVFDGNVIKIGGFSDKLFEIVDLLEQDKNALIKKIEAIEL